MIWNRLFAEFEPHLAGRTCNFIDDVGEHNVLIVRCDTQFLPLGVLTKANVVARKWMWHTEITWKQRNERRVLVMVDSNVIQLPQCVESFAIFEYQTGR